MADNRKYYYLKLKESYFDDDSIVLLESMQDGILYSYILLKLYLKSLKNGGKLRLDEHIPYTAQMIASETGLLHCGKCHTPIQCRVTLFDKEKLMPCTCRCRQEQIAAEEQSRKEQQRLDRIRRLKANGLQERKLTREQLHAAIATLSDKQAKRIYAHYFLGMSKTAIAKAEGVSEKAIRNSIERGLAYMEQYLKNNL